MVIKIKNEWYKHCIKQRILGISKKHKDILALVYTYIWFFFSHKLIMNESILYNLL